MSKRSKNPVTRAQQNARRMAKRKARLQSDPAFSELHYRRKTLSKYSITPADYATMQTAQKGKCGICGLEPLPDDKHLAVDHDHTTLYIRGLLCFECNTGIGKLKHDIRLLQRAIEWIGGAQ